MQDTYANILRNKMDDSSFSKLEALDNDKLHAFIADAVELCSPDEVFVCSDADEDIAHIRQLSIDNKEERSLATEGHTVHFDQFINAKISDQGRDPRVTKYLLPEDVDLGERLNSMDREEGLTEIRGLFKDSMKGRTMLVAFLSLGPTDSPFSIQCAQITDSAYVVHSEHMLYRTGYEQFKKLGQEGEFFRFLHATGEVDDRMCSKNMDKKRVYIDITEDMVMSVNTQYAGNTVGLKKLALRLALRKADREGWLAEHMFIMGVHGPNDRVTYFTGAFPSACGKTSTAMIPGETIIGDDLAYLRVIDGKIRTVNTEAGIFGIIRDVNSEDDPVIWDVINKPGEVIFGNVLVKDGKPYWEGMGQELPEEGENYSGRWKKGQCDDLGNELPPSHRNARYTVRMSDLENRDPHWDDPQGVEVGGIMYGGRDSDTSVPVQESFGWQHGIATMGAALESETTAATVGQEGVRKFDLMSIMQFVAIPLGKYLQNNLDFGKKSEKTPKIFGTNYFLKKDGKFLNGMRDKAVWVKWMDRRANGEVDAIEAPTGMLPEYEDLKALFKEVLNKDYSQDDYVEQFTIRIPELLAKIERITNIYNDIEDTPKEIFEQLSAQKDRLEALQKEKGDYVSPLDL
ncbi:MAG: phosphoenolpyruvate carboxykinase (GTP) [Phycisphaerae bacterium]